MSIEELKRPERADEIRIEMLKELFPEAFSDGKLNVDVLHKEIEGVNENLIEDKPEEFYGLQWVGKREAKKLSILPPNGTLKYLEGEGVNENSTDNYLLEGDNLEVLRILQKSYSSKIKLINIDPPYNTGNDFVYKDDFKDSLEKYLQKSGQADEEGLLTSNPKSNGRYHANWLNMMYPRIKLSRNLLTKDGVILVNIDEHEIHNMILLLNEIFGEDNYLGTIVWDKKNPKGDSTTIAIQHEYIVCYAKSKNEFVKSGGMSRKKPNALRMLKKASELYNKLGKKGYPDDLLRLSKKYNIPKEYVESHEIEYDLDLINKEFNSWIKRQDNLTGGEKAYSKIDQNGEVYQPVSMAWPNKKKAPDDYFVPLIHPITMKPCPVPERGWRNPSETMKRLLESDEILFGEDETTQPRRKYLLKDNLLENVPSVLSFGGSDDALFSELEIPFENPKPFNFVKQLITYITKEDDIILDFFAGSGTTGHAVVEANREDGGNRSFLLVQIPEPIDNNKYENVAEITKDRLRKCIAKINNEDKSNFGFKVFKLDKSHIRKWNDFNGNDIEALNEQIDFYSTSPFLENSIEMDIITELMLYQGFPLNSSVTKKKIELNTIYLIQHFDIPFKLIVCLDENLKKQAEIFLTTNYKNETLICLDDALTNEQKIKLSEKFNVKTL